MITERARSSFERLLLSSLRGGMPAAGANIDVSAFDSLALIGEKKIVVLTVSSYLFRAMAILYFKPDAATRAYFDRNAAEGAPALGDDEFNDRLAECGNVCCGALNRELGAHFPHVGMSTPNIIDRDCMKYVDLLGCDLVKHYRIVLDGELTMYASLCVASYGVVDFHVDPAAAANVDTGELELF
jgi:hypothetical protein